MLSILMGRISFYAGGNISTSKSINAPSRRQDKDQERISLLANGRFLENNDKGNIQMMMRTTKNIYGQKPT